MSLKDFVVTLPPVTLYYPLLRRLDDVVHVDRSCRRMSRLLPRGKETLTTYHLRHLCTWCSGGLALEVREVPRVMEVVTHYKGSFLHHGEPLARLFNVMNINALLEGLPVYRFPPAVRNASSEVRSPLGVALMEEVQRSLRVLYQEELEVLRSPAWFAELVEFLEETYQTGHLAGEECLLVSRTAGLPMSSLSNERESYSDTVRLLVLHQLTNTLEGSLPHEVCLRVPAVVAQWLVSSQAQPRDHRLSPWSTYAMASLQGNEPDVVLETAAGLFDPNLHVSLPLGTLDGALVAARSLHSLDV